MEEAASSGDTRLDVQTTSGFEFGGRIVINPGCANQEENEIVGFGSLLLAQPLKFAHSPGETVQSLGPVSVAVKPNQEDSRRELTEEQRQQRQRTNRSNRDDENTEGNVVEVGEDSQGRFVVIANRDGNMVVRLGCASQCPTIKVGDYIEAEDTKEHEQLFFADVVCVAR